MSVRLPVLVFAGLLLVSLVAYFPSLDGGFVWDDLDYVSENEALRTAGGLRRIWLEPEASPQYYPLVLTSFWLEHRVFGDAPRGYHLVNLVLHAVNAFLLWCILRRLAVPGALLAAAIFALHPVHVESVAWITERKNVLSGLFFFATILAWLRFRATRVASPRDASWGWYGASLALFACALLSKTATCPLPMVLLLILWWQQGRVAGRDLSELAPFFVLGALAPMMTWWIESGYVVTEGGFVLTWPDRLLLAGRAFWFYVGKLAWPAELIFIYPRWEVSAFETRELLYVVAAVGLVAALWALRSRVGRGPLACVLVFAAMLAPTLGLIDYYFMRYSYVADHFQYLGSVGLIVLFSATATVVLERLWPGGRRASAAAACALIAVLGFRTWERAHAYQDEERLWRDTIVKNPAAWMAWNNLGQRLLLRGEPEKAIPYVSRAIELERDCWEAYGGLAQAYEALGRPDLAEQVYAAVAVRIAAAEGRAPGEEAGAPGQAD